MQEVVAKRKENLIFAHAVFVVVGLIFLAVGIDIAIEENAGLGAFGAVFGFAFIALGVWQIVAYCKVPKEVIVYSDGMLYLPKGVCISPLDITHCKITIALRRGISSRWGKLTLTIADGRKLSYNFVDYITDVQQRLGELKSECYNKMMREKYEAEAMARVASQVATDKKSEEAAPAKKPDDSDPFNLQ